MSDCADVCVCVSPTLDHDIKATCILERGVGASKQQRQHNVLRVCGCQLRVCGCQEQKGCTVGICVREQRLLGSTVWVRCMKVESETHKKCKGWLKVPRSEGLLLYRSHPICCAVSRCATEDCSTNQSPPFAPCMLQS